MSQVILPAKLEEPFATQPGAAKTWRAVAFPFRLWGKIARFNVASEVTLARKPGQKTPHGLLATKAGIDMQGKGMSMRKRQNAWQIFSVLVSTKLSTPPERAMPILQPGRDHFCPVHCHADSFSRTAAGHNCVCCDFHGKYLRKILN